MVEAKLKKIEIPSRIVVRELAEKLGRPVTDIISQLMHSGVMSSLNELIDFDTAAIIAGDLGFELVLKEGEDDEKTSVESLVSAEAKENLKPRPPVVVVMGHVDHGKTKLLDAIRQTNVVDQEAGGITQHISSYQVTERDRIITFIDTPGHEAFTAMRSRGARVADLAILVVAADDGVKPQTVEAIKIIEEARIPMIVAINKVDLPSANPDRIQQQLAEKNVLVEDWSGKVPVINVSAKNKTGITELLDLILLVTDMHQGEIMANPNREAIGTVIESHIDKGIGPVAVVVIQTGTLRIGDLITVGGTGGGKVRVMHDFLGRNVLEAIPSQPVEICGLKTASKVGDILTVIDKKELAKIRKQKIYKPSTPTVHLIKKEVEEQKAAGGEKKEIKKFNLVLKADTLGSLEAIINSLQKIKCEEISVNVVAKGLGNITEADVLRATTSQAELYGFHVAVTPSAEEVAKGQKFTIQTFTIIYDLINAVLAELEKLLEPEIIHTTLGELKVLAVFRVKLPTIISGGRITSGKFTTGARVKIIRQGQEVGSGKIEQLQINKQGVAEAPAGREIGMKINSRQLIEVGDTIQAFSEEVKQKKLILE
ncbi:MAG: translation initiation factor IF-2 [Patescibacteria group bacterium]|nr:translation initiation factor IF-2 [Patescibacteria group bacterium]